MMLALIGTQEWKSYDSLLGAVSVALEMSVETLKATPRLMMFCSMERTKALWLAQKGKWSKQAVKVGYFCAIDSYSTEGRFVE